MSGASAPVAADTLASAFASGDQVHPTILAPAGGGCVVVRQSEGRDGSASGIFAQRFAAFGQSIDLKTFGRRIGLTRDLIVNDDLNPPGDAVRAFGETAARTEAAIMAAMPTGNPEMRDGTPVFDASRGGIGGAAGPPSEAASTETGGAQGREMPEDSRKFPLKYVVEDGDRHGDVRLCRRRNGRNVRLRGPAGSPEFPADDRAAAAGPKEVETYKTGPAVPESVKRLRVQHVKSAMLQELPPDPEGSPVRPWTLPAAQRRRGQASRSIAAPPYPRPPR